MQGNIEAEQAEQRKREKEERRKRQEEERKQAEEEAAAAAAAAAAKVSILAICIVSSTSCISLQCASLIKLRARLRSSR